MRKIIFLYTLSFLCLSGYAQQMQNIYLLTALHGLHKQNSNYDYDTLRAMISSIDPDLILAEIRQEDMGRDSSYLAANYPYEMRMMSQWFPDKKTMGFDWLGDDLKGKAIPEGYWKQQSPVKQWEAALNSDTSISVPCDTIANERLALLKRITRQQLSDGLDEAFVREYYACLTDVLSPTIHKRLVSFYRQRDQNMAANIFNILQRSNARRVVIIAGADHIPFLEDNLRLAGIRNGILRP